ncbi:unnamed protein product [Oikopleura dioica]|uniref:Uncharacterized protein n=1 Tax=Oikopleura dioica TaxID=34765 RepID=E4YY66_OIKDI|nr:unnamed protein product [Oikopleura dioica]
MIALTFSIIGVIFRYMAFNAIPEAEHTRLFGPDSTATESDLCPPVILNNEIYDTELKEEGYFEVNVLVKWAHLCYMIAFFMMFVSALQFYALNSLLGPLTIAIGEMIKDFVVFLGILLIFVVPFGIIMMSLLYPNETRDSKYETMFFKPFMMLFGEMFKSELSDYAFETVDDCIPNSRIFLTPKSTVGRNVYNPEDNKYSFLQDKIVNVTGVEETHPLFGVPYFSPANLLPEKSKLTVYGLIQLQALKDQFAIPKNGLIVNTNWFKNFEWRRAKYGIPSFENGSDGAESALFIPSDENAQNGDFSRCPERYWVNSVFLMLYVLFAVVMILNLLVAMFATTYSRVRGDSSTIWKKQRYNLVIEYYNNPAKPITPPLILFLDIYWVIKFAVLSRCWSSANYLAAREVNHPRVLGQHSLRLPPIYVNDKGDLYKKIFQALAVIESKAANEEDKTVTVEDLEGMIESLQVRVDCLTEQESAKDK